MEAKRHNTKKCIKCKQYFDINESNSRWDYGGYTITKLAQCTCGCWQAVKFEAEKNVNYDPRYYE